MKRPDFTTRKELRGRSYWYCVVYRGGSWVVGPRGGCRWFRTREEAKALADELNGKVPAAAPDTLIED